MEPPNQSFGRSMKQLMFNKSESHDTTIIIQEDDRIITDTQEICDFSILLHTLQTTFALTKISHLTLILKMLFQI